MLQEYLLSFKNQFSFINLFDYLTFRVSISTLTALCISFIVGPKIIKILKTKNIGEEIREDGPPGHLSKKGTPTMGGVIILISVLIPTILFSKTDTVMIQIIIFSTIWMGLIGFIDDYYKTIKRYKNGIIARYKFFGQIILGIIISYWITNSSNYDNISTITTVPFLKNVEFDLGYLYPLFVIVVITATSNAVNLTDGLDGLAAGLLSICFTVFIAVAYISGRTDFSTYLNIMYIPNIGELSVFSGAMAGACIGFLWFNASPAEVFMGDTGSLSTGAALGTLAILLKKELLLFIIGGVFVMETISVIIQLSYFRITKHRYGSGRRLFKMAPIHHHFEIIGWVESKIVTRFWIIGILLALLSLTTFKIR